MPTHEELAGNLCHELCHETAVDVSLQELASLLTVIKALLMQKERQFAAQKKYEERLDVLRDLLIIQNTQNDFTEKIYSQVNYDPGNSDYIQLRPQMAKVFDICMEVGIRWNVIKLPVGAGRFSSWEGSA